MKMQDEKEIINESNKELHSGKNTNMLVAAFMFFIFPIITTALGAFIGGYIGKFMGTSIEISQIIGGIVSFVLSVVIIKIFDKFIKVDENAKKIDWDDM